MTPRIGDEETASDWVAAVLAADTAAIYMGAGQAEAIAATLIARGRPADTPVAVVRDASLSGSTARTGQLRDLAALCAADDTPGTPGPAVILLGAALRAAAAARQLEPQYGVGSVRQLRQQPAG